MPHSPSNAPPTQDGPSSDISRAPSSQDPFYSNNDIRALHDIVVAAQESLDTTPEPKPLPAAALFKAYDKVLPKYGIDPDTDHHLSTLMFRIGGEKGSGSLLDKFQAILGRMGIVLEFGDNTTVSFQTSPSNSPPFPLSKQQTDAYRDIDSGSHIVDDIEEHKPFQHADNVLIQNETHNEVDGQVNGLDNSQIPLAPRHAAFSSVMARWHALVSRREADTYQDQVVEPDSTKDPGGDKTVEGVLIPTKPASVNNEEPVTQSHRSKLKLESPVDDRISEIRPPITSTYVDAWDSARNAQDVPFPLSHYSVKERYIVTPQLDVDRNEERTQPAIVTNHIAARDDMQHSTRRTFSQEVGQDHIPELSGRQEEERMLIEEPLGYETPCQIRKSVEVVEKTSDHQRDLKRAARAREIYLASKVFNHWADRTARRLERDALARRHMIRFRCFRGWSQAPPSKEHVVDRLKVITAIRKWKRSLLDQERYLQAATKEVAEAHRQRKLRKASDQWCYHYLGDVAQHHQLLHGRSTAVAKWNSHASSLSQLKIRVQTANASRTMINAVDEWHSVAEKGIVRADAARQIGSVHRSCTYLREWWDQAEMGRRANMFRQYILLKKAAFAFNQWNLQARTQAFVWQREYQSVIHVFSKWHQDVEHKGGLQQRAKTLYGNRTKLIVLDKFERQRKGVVLLPHLQQRARLFIGATTLLRVLDVALQQRRRREKQELKRYMMKRYTQMSSKRKRRNFFSALDRWRTSTSIATEQEQRIDEFRMQRNTQKLLLAVKTWSSKAQDDQQRYEDAQVLHIRDWVAAWREYAQFVEQQEIDSWQLWVTEKQRQCVKQWSISTLQQSGQAHTASKIDNRYQRERRNRSLQHWRQETELTQNRKHEPDSLPALKLFPRSSYGRSWRGRSMRRSMARDSDTSQDNQANPFETPTRWTGLALPMSNLGTGRRMHAVDELGVGEVDVELSDAGEEASARSPVFDKEQPHRMFALASTTPKAPVPTYLKRGIPASDTGTISSARTLQQNIPATSTRDTILSSAELRGTTTAGRSVVPTPSAVVNSRRHANTQSARVQLPYKSHSRLPVNKSVAAISSSMRYATPQTTRSTLATRSVRIQSPRSLSIMRTGKDFPSPPQ